MTPLAEAQIAYAQALQFYDFDYPHASKELKKDYSWIRIKRTGVALQLAAGLVRSIRRTFAKIDRAI